VAVWRARESGCREEKLELGVPFTVAELGDFVSQEDHSQDEMNGLEEN